MWSDSDGASGKLPERCAHRLATQINSNTQYGTLSVAIEGRLMPLAGAARKFAAVRTERAGKLKDFTLWKEVEGFHKDFRAWKDLGCGFWNG